ncbi:DUF6233 domain-containing protein [Streptomyces himalayensis]|uniref:Uncharacterized protein n=1 Tax=Streptomyces himalayensis subsp. himalayensis TaxID=2756131 RepID=A0A7W0IE62_9ACTN|nr:DUF6233 domain-containing protein [Streptomyces himalayensis]MBA2951979.1 hypothetical protein [Streptomyces himalayensis subsp. himalayensis]
MSDLPPDADRLRVIVTYLRLQLAEAEAALRQAEQREADEKRRRDRARAEQAWKLQPQRSDGPPVLHRGGCSIYRNEMGYLDREHALIALELDDPRVECCEVCRPETGLASGR